MHAVRQHGRKVSMLLIKIVTNITLVKQETSKQAGTHTNLSLKRFANEFKATCRWTWP